MIREIVIGVISILVAVFVYENWDNLPAKTEELIDKTISTISSFLVIGSESERKCLKSINEGLDFLNKKYEPMGKIEKIEGKTFSLKSDAINYINKWGPYVTDVSALKDLSNYPENTTITVHILKLTFLTSTQFILEIPAGTSLRDAVVCDAEGNLMEKSNKLFD